MKGPRLRNIVLFSFLLALSSSVSYAGGGVDPEPDESGSPGSGGDAPSVGTLPEDVFITLNGTSLYCQSGQAGRNSKRVKIRDAANKKNAREYSCATIQDDVAVRSYGSASRSSRK